MRDHRLDAEMRAFIQTSLELSSQIDANIAAQRAAYDQACGFFHAAYPAGVCASDSEIQGRHGAIALRHYALTPGRSTQARIVFLHGGGFTLGGLESHDDICAELCAATGFDTLSIDYRLAPEYSHPVQLDDVEDAFLHGWQENSILVGVSAGATLAAGLSHRLKSQDCAAHAQVLVYPALGGEELELESYSSNADAPLLSSDDIRYYRQARCVDGIVPFDDPEFYPLAATDYCGLPASVVFSADIDPLRDDGELYVARLQQAGVPARWHNELGLVHDYLRARHSSEKAGAAFARIGTAIKFLAQSTSLSTLQLP